MSVEDPFFVVKSEVEKSVSNCRSLQQEWRNILNGVTPAKRDDYDRISNELKNSIRSIEWDLEDLDETIGIVESNPRKFQITEDELKVRKDFIAQNRHTVHSMKDELNNPKTKKSADKIFRQSLLQSTRLNQFAPKNGYSALIDETHENDNDAFVQDQTQRQQMIIDQQDEQLSLVADSVGVLKHMSQSIGNELDEQTVILNELGTEMDSTQHKMDTILRKMAKVTHMADDRRQWCAIGILGSSMFAIFILFFIL